MDIPHPYLSRILAALVHADVLLATAGQTGGYELARPPGRITLLDVIEAVEEPTDLERCVLRGIPCRPNAPCSVHSSWSSAQNALRRELRKTTFARLVREEHRLS